ncbi:MAG TPA: glycosyltransferase family 9 protein [Bryobacteraceae bacterium]|nr:glycosyltransferase family 9 protein [Bryobacteraceae bacterium]
MTELDHGCRVAVIRLRSLGDCVLTTPALDILKRARPDVRIAVVVEDRFRAVFEGNPDIDRLLAPGVRELRAWRPGLCLNLHGGSASARMTAFSGAAWRAGFAHYRWQALYNVRIPRAQEILDEERIVHTAEHLASAMFYLGVPRGEIPRAKLFATGAAIQPARPYAVIHPIASAPDKTWHAAGFLEAARFLKESLEPVFIAGPGEDLSAFSEYRTVIGAPLSEIKSLLRGAALFLGNDSGPAHMAAAFGLPVVVLFSASDPAIWGPWRTPSAIIRNASERQVREALERIRVHA